MRENWKYLPLGELCDVLDSKRKPITKNKRQAGSIPYYGATGVLDYVKDYIFDEKLVLLGEDGAKWGAGENSAYIINGKTWVNNHAHALRPHRDIICDEFLVCYLNYTDLSDSITGVTVPKLNQEKMRAITIPVPPLSEQERIVALLDTQFAKIDALKANADLQLQAAKDLFQSALKQLLTPQEGWEEKKLGEICEIARGGSPRPIKDYITNAPNSVNWIKIGDTDPAGKYIYETKEKIKPEGIKKSRWVEKNDFILSNSMSFGRPYILKTNGCIHDGWLVLRNYNKDLYIDFFYYVLTSPDIQHQFTIKAQGSTVSNLNTDRVASVSISFPSLPEQERIAARLDAISEKVKALQANYDQTINLCNDLKQSLLKSIFA